MKNCLVFEAFDSFGMLRLVHSLNKFADFYDENFTKCDNSFSPSNYLQYFALNDPPNRYTIKFLVLVPAC